MSSTLTLRMMKRFNYFAELCWMSWRFSCPNIIWTSYQSTSNLTVCAFWSGAVMGEMWGLPFLTSSSEKASSLPPMALLWLQLFLNQFPETSIEIKNYDISLTLIFYVCRSKVLKLGKGRRLACTTSYSLHTSFMNYAH